MIELWILLIVILTFFISGTITYLSTSVLDAYMGRGEILDFIRIKIARKLAAKHGIEFDEKGFEDISSYETAYPFFERKEKYDSFYWAIAFFDKRMNLVICKDCMSVYIGFIITLFFTVPIIAYIPLVFVYKVLLIPTFWFINNLATWKLLNFKSE